MSDQPTDHRLATHDTRKLDLLTRLRAHKAALTALLSGNVCRHCGRPMAWPAPVGVILADGTAEHHECRLLVAGQRAVAEHRQCPGDQLEVEARFADIIEVVAQAGVQLRAPDESGMPAVAGMTAQGERKSS